MEPKYCLDAELAHGLGIFGYFIRGFFRYSNLTHIGGTGFWGLGFGTEKKKKKDSIGCLSV